MCGVIGFFGADKNSFEKNKNAIEALIFFSSIRGTHSFGFAHFDEETLVYAKAFTREDIWKHLEDARPRNFIFHNRYSTSGDWAQMANNQPVVFNQEALVFNGVISQATREENQENFGMELETENDGEIFLRHPEKAAFLRDMGGSFAGIWMSKGEFFFGRNDQRPLWTASSQDKSFFIGSTQDIFQRSGKFSNCVPVQSRRVYDVGGVIETLHS